MLSTIIISAVLGAIGGAIGAGISAFVFADREPAERPRWVIGVCVAVALVVSQPIAHWWSTPTAASVLRDLEQQQPVFALMREKEPQAYQRFSAIIDQAIASGSRFDVNDATRRGREVFADVVARRSRTASDRQVATMVQFVRDQASVSIAEEPLIAAATNLATAMPRFAASAA